MKRILVGPPLSVLQTISILFSLSSLVLLMLGLVLGEPLRGWLYFSIVPVFGVAYTSLKLSRLRRFEAVLALLLRNDEPSRFRFARLIRRSVYVERTLDVIGVCSAISLVFLTDGLFQMGVTVGLVVFALSVSYLEMNNKKLLQQTSEVLN
ncbi:MAG: hypothetical protein KF867_06720 [Cryobacterium sp.]|nr:hypothetical protein [Cryobacterium sp.]